MIRLLNVPPSVSDEDIRSIALNWAGVVLNVDSERLPHLFEEIKTFVRRIRIRFSSRQDEDKVPISISFSIALLSPFNLKADKLDISTEKVLCICNCLIIS